MKSKLKYKLRFISVLLLLVILNLGLNINSVSETKVMDYLYKSTNDTTSSEYFYVTAKNGDTIWNIAKSNYNHIEKPDNIDFRDLVLVITDLNGGSELSIGQSVKLPKNVK